MSASTRHPKMHAHISDAREDAIRLAQETGCRTYVRCDAPWGYFASLDPGRNPITTFDPERLPALPVCALAEQGWLVGGARRRTECPACGRRIRVKADGTCTPHRPKQSQRGDRP